MTGRAILAALTVLVAYYWVALYLEAWPTITDIVHQYRHHLAVAVAVTVTVAAIAGVALYHLLVEGT